VIPLAGPTDHSTSEILQQARMQAADAERFLGWIPAELAQFPVQRLHLAEVVRGHRQTEEHRAEQGEPTQDSEPNTKPVDRMTTAPGLVGQGCVRPFPCSTSLSHLEKVQHKTLVLAGVGLTAAALEQRPESIQDPNNQALETAAIAWA
jgi:hypothetical protein